MGRPSREGRLFYCDPEDDLTDRLEKLTGPMAELENLLEPLIDDLGFEVVRLQFNTGGGRPHLQVMAEPKDGSVMGVEGCSLLSREISALLDVEDPIASAFDLEVSSPGTDRPLTRLKDFARYVGYEAKIETHDLIDGQKRYRGDLDGVEGSHIKFTAEQSAQTLPFDQLAKAKLVLNDKLTRAAMKGQFPPPPVGATD